MFQTRFFQHANDAMLIKLTVNTKNLMASLDCFLQQSNPQISIIIHELCHHLQH